MENYGKVRRFDGLFPGVYQEKTDAISNLEIADSMRKIYDPPV